MLRGAIAALSLALTISPPAFGQGFPIFSEPMPVAIADQDRLFVESQFGRRIMQDIIAQRSNLAAENRQIEDALEEEELSLTERRATLPNDEFRALARDFDDRVVTIREEQNAKITALSQAEENARRIFFQAAQPIIQSYLEENQIEFLLSTSAVLVSSNRGDITVPLVARIDEVIGNGQTLLQRQQPE